MYYRHELKFEVSDIELLEIEYRIRNFMKKDIHQKGDFYLIRSMYFDDFRNTCYEENVSGVDNRTKYRIRSYDASSEIILLEKKCKKRGMTHKESVSIPYKQCEQYMNGEVPLLTELKSDLEIELFSKAKSSMLMPKCIVEYERSAFVLDKGNVRVTFDRNIRGTNNMYSFFDERIDAVPVMSNGTNILEVKYDEYLPNYLLAVLDLGNLRKQSFSKYASVRTVLGVI